MSLETGETTTLISPTVVPFSSSAARVDRVAKCVQRDSGLAEPCSLTSRRGGVGCEEPNSLQRGVKRGGDIQHSRHKTGQ